MAEEKRLWTYFDEANDRWVEPFLTRKQLDELAKAGTIDGYTRVVDIRTAPPGPAGRRAVHGVPYSSLPTSDVEFDPEPEEFHTARAGRPTTVLSGPNNQGKTFYLKHLYAAVGHTGYFVACNRFSQIDILNSRQREEHEHFQRYESFVYNFQSSRHNSEDNEMKLDQILTGLKDKQRDKMFEVAGRLIGNTFNMVPTDPENKFSPFYVTMDDKPISTGSSGTRLLLTLLGMLLDERFTTLLIDEPEIGLSPRIQGKLAKFLYDLDERKAFCPHLTNLYIATHSHIFLDRGAYANNFVVTKKENVISARSLGTASELHEVQFNMLGNDLELLYLPAAIVLVEGETDAMYGTKLVGFNLPGRKVAFVRANGEGEVLKKINYFKESFGDLATSPYRDRLFVLYDKTITTSLTRIENVGVRKDNIVVLTKNGIEHYYPPAHVARAFHCDEADVPRIPLGSDPVGYNGHRYSKMDLGKFVAERLMASDPIHPEIQTFLDKLTKACE
jgi:hypothetical protein